MRELRPTSGPEYRPPISANACRATASSTTTEHLLDLGSAHAVEVIRHDDLPCHEAQSLDLRWFRRVQRNHFHQGFARFGDDKGLTLGGLVHQPGELGFCLMYVEGLHSALLD